MINYSCQPHFVYSQGLWMRRENGGFTVKLDHPLIQLNLRDLLH